MALRVPNGGSQGLFKEGYKMSSGLEDAVIRNIHAVGELQEMVRTSFGPNGRNKMVINRLSKLFITCDAATIIREVDVVHPAAKVIVMASQQQEAELGDRTNFVLIFAGELLRKAEHLLVLGMHPSEIAAGYELARDRALTELESLTVKEVAFPLSRTDLVSALRPALAAKQYGYEDLLSGLVSDAVLAVMPSNPRQFNVDAIRVVKVMGGGLSASTVLKGMVFGRVPEGIVKSATHAKVAVFTSGIDIAQTETKGTVLLKNSSELLNFSRDEETHMQAIFQEIADSGVRVVVAGGGIGELALHFLNRLGIMVVKVLSKFDLRRLCRVVGALPLARLGAPTPDEAGFCDAVETVELGGDRVTVFRQSDEATRVATVVLRGATVNQMDDIERAIDDGVHVIKGLLKDGRLVGGAGSTEIELAARIAAYGARTPGLAQHGITRFAEALEVVPRTLAENAGLDATETVSRLYAAHKEGRVHAGVGIEDAEGVVDAKEDGILDLYSATSWALKYATDAAVTVLKVDSIIMSRPAGGPAPPKQNP